MKVVFRVDASFQIGSGHVMRCLTFARVLKSNDVEVDFICRQHDGNLIDKIRMDGFNVFALDFLPDSKVDSSLPYSNWLGTTQYKDAKQCVDILKLKEVDWLIIDHYALDKDWHNQVNKFCNKLMVIDDIADRKLNCDILLNQNLGVTKDDYRNKVNEECRFLLGCHYALLSANFAKLRKEALIKRQKTKTIKTILISMGGSDPNNITFDILQSIDNDVNIIVVLGWSSPHIEMIKHYAINKNIEVLVGVNNMAELMLDADLSIGAGGSTSWERCCLGLPTLLYIMDNNQRNIAMNLEKIGAVIIVNNLQKNLSFILNNINIWRSIYSQAYTLTDGLGASRVVNYLL